MTKINSLDTFAKPLVEIAPRENELSFRFMSELQALQDIANDKWIGIVLYCTVCKEPLDYTYYNGNVVFECPKCGAKWVKNTKWEKDSKNGIRKYKNIRSRISKE